MDTILAHHWYFQPRGGERVIVELSKIFPNAPILTSFATSNTKNWPKEIADLRKKIIPSKLQKIFELSLESEFSLPLLLLLMPYFLSNSFKNNLSNSERLIINEAGLAKIIAPRVGTKNYVYIHAPMRLVWDEFTISNKKILNLLYPFSRLAINYLRKKDLEAVKNIHKWAANSKSTAKHVCDTYNLNINDFRVIYPPVTLGGELKNIERKGLLVVTSMQPYKRDDLAIKAANALNLPLTIVGNGPLKNELKKIAGSSVKFLGYLSDEDCKLLMEQSEALIYCGKEDFGITPVEAMSRGCPVLAYGAGGALETVTENLSGLFFSEQNTESVIAGIKKMNSLKWDSTKIRNSVLKFSEENFKTNFLDWCDG